MPATRDGKVLLALSIPFIAFVLVVSITPARIGHGYQQNESAAIGGLRTLAQLEQSYSTSHAEKGFACDLANLRPEGSSELTNDRVIALAGGRFSGYRFTLTGCSSDETGKASQYEIYAIPESPGNTGVSAFCSDQTGEIFVDPDGSAAACLTNRRQISK